MPAEIGPRCGRCGAGWLLPTVAHHHVWTRRPDGAALFRSPRPYGARTAAVRAAARHGGPGAVVMSCRGECRRDQRPAVKRAASAARWRVAAAVAAALGIAVSLRHEPRPVWFTGPRPTAATATHERGGVSNLIPWRAMATPETPTPPPDPRPAVCSHCSCGGVWPVPMPAEIGPRCGRCGAGWLLPTVAHHHVWTRRPDGAALFRSPRPYGARTAAVRAAARHGGPGAVVMSCRGECRRDQRPAVKRAASAARWRVAAAVAAALGIAVSLRPGPRPTAATATHERGGVSNLIPWRAMATPETPTPPPDPRPACVLAL